MGSSEQRAEVERRFPLITHLWPNVEQFRCLSAHKLLLHPLRNQHARRAPLAAPGAPCGMLSDGELSCPRMCHKLRA